MDDRGHVVTVETPFEGAKEAAYLATVGPDPLVSQFTPSYGMVLNLLQTHTLAEARTLIERSFGQYLANLHLAPQQAAVQDLQYRVEHQRSQLADFDEAVLADYEKLKERLREEKRLLKTLQQQAAEVLSGDMGPALAFAIAGTTLSLKGKHVAVSDPLPAVLVTKVPGSGQFPYLVCLSRDNHWYVVTVGDVVGLHAEYPRMTGVDDLMPPADLPPKAGQRRKGDDTTAAIALQIPQPPPLEAVAPEVKDQLDRVQGVEDSLNTHAVLQWGNPKNLMKQWRRLQRMEEELRDRQRTLAQLSDRYWQEFASIMVVLTHFGALKGDQPTNLGEIAAAIRGDNELWLGLALASGELDHLTAPELAATCTALTVECNRPDTWTAYAPSPVVESALEGLRDLRRELFQQQRRQQVVVPVWMEYDLIGLVEAWTDMGERRLLAAQGFGTVSADEGGDWTELCNNTSLDEGDIVRVLRRTLDFLSQIPHVPHISDALRDTARRTATAMNRFPVNESVS
jgi:superfamily II RNA helicase